MKKTSLLILLIGMSLNIKAQNYNPLNYSLNGTPVNGIKIKTNLPYQNGSQMPTIMIEGYNYGKKESIGIILNWYIYYGNFINYSASSHGAYSPPIKLANENGKVIIYIESKEYFNRFQIRAYAKGMPQDIAVNYQGWTAVDEPIGGTNIVSVEYKTNNDSLWVEDGTDVSYNQGYVGIGTTQPDSPLSVEGKIHCREVLVDTEAFADYVFKADYNLKPLEEVENYIIAEGHLEGFKSEKEIVKEGINLKELTIKQQEKIEELTLYLIELSKEVKELKTKLKE